MGNNKLGLSMLFRMVGTLVLITVLSAGLLGYMDSITRLPKSEAERAKQNFAIQAVLTEYDNDPSADMYTIASADGGEELTCYPATKNGELTGTAVKTWTNNGFSGLVRLMVGMDPQGKIIKVAVLEQKETPGLGTKMTEANFLQQFEGKALVNQTLQVKKDGGDVDAITAATISSRAFCDAVNRAGNSMLKAGKIIEDKGGNDESIE